MKTMDSADAQYKKMTETPIPKLIIELGIPTTISMLITNVYNMADTFFVGQLGSTSASGATGIVFGLMSIIQAFGFMYGQGAGSLISRHLGQKDPSSASKYASVSFAAALISGAMITLLGSIFMDPLLSLLGSTPTILEFARDYAVYILFSAPFMAASFVLNNILRYEGKAFFAMIGLTTGGILNMIGDPIFMFGCNMDIAGAGLSTALSQIISFSILLFMFLSGRTQSKLSIRNITEPFSRLGEIIKTGFPSMARQGFASVATMLLNNQAAAFGQDAAVAAMSIVSRINMFIFAVGLGIGQGFQPVAGYNYGARKYSRVKSGYFFTMAAGGVLIGALAVIGLIFSGNVIAIFRDDPNVIKIGTLAMRFHCLALFVQPVCVCSNMLFQSVGKSGRATFTAILRSGLYFLPLIAVLPYFIGILGVQIAQPMADFMTFLTVIPIAFFFIRSLPEDGAEPV